MARSTPPRDLSTPPRPGSKTRAEILAVDGDHARRRADHLATEEPMEIRLQAGGETRTVAVTMRTPGSDFELAAGFLFGEGVVTPREAIERITYCMDPEVDADQQYNIVTVALREERLPDLASLERHFYTTSACGACGKASLEALRLRSCPVIPPGPEVAPDLLAGLPERLREAQGIFKVTGGLHAAVLFDAGGAMVSLREDVGRHNAMDKLIGWALLDGRLPLHDHIVMVSGRASFELLQKSVVAGLPIFCAVSAPSSLAVDVAKAFGITLVGFLRGRKFNVYSAPERIRISGSG
ncbi:MAG: formate dehydrogenase accessory sulfurtransferase FdhD [Candidatus Methylomirabilaceae bacterium]